METAEKLCDDILLIDKSKKVLSGTMREIKESYGKNIVSLRCDGGTNVLEDGSLVIKVVAHSDEKEVFLADEVDPQTLLKKLVEDGASVTKFEMIEPSLNDIFIEKVSL